MTGRDSRPLYLMKKKKGLREGRGGGILIDRNLDAASSERKAKMTQLSIVANELASGSTVEALRRELQESQLSLQSSSNILRGAMNSMNCKE